MLEPTLVSMQCQQKSQNFKDFWPGYLNLCDTSFIIGNPFSPSQVLVPNLNYVKNSIVSQRNCDVTLLHHNLLHAHYKYSGKSSARSSLAALEW